MVVTTDIAEPVVHQEGSRPAAAAGARVESVDILRGVVMVLMALDHARRFVTDVPFDPTDLARTSAPLFFTRWITHFCAPVFFLLAGTAAFLALARGKPKRELSRFLFVRGVWLMVLELTVVALAWSFAVDCTCIDLGVFWALGWSMVVLAGLIHLPRFAVVLIGFGMIASHNLCDGVSPASLGAMAWLGRLLHVPGPIEGTPLVVGYPLVPWIGVMALGFALGAVFQRSAAERRRFLVGAGLLAAGAFVVLRGASGYGDPLPWARGDRPVLSVLSFVNATKYPPSLVFLLMTLGPSLVALALFERASGPIARFFLVFGRVPLFFYVLHLFVVHAIALAVACFQGGQVGFLFGASASEASLFPPWYGFGLPGVYAVWWLVVLLLYWPCRRFAELKRRHPSGWLTYL